MRARNLKPGFFKNEELAKLSPLTRLLFAGLWCMADRAGRLEDRPERIKAEVLPYDNCDIHAMLNDLQNAKEPFVKRYKAGTKLYIQVISAPLHFHPHPNEKHSEIPACSKKLLPKVKALQPLDGALGLNPSSLKSDLLKSDIALMRTLSPKVGPERREYRIPEPKDDPLGGIVMYYKAVRKAVAYDDRLWDKQHFARVSKAAKALLEICGSYEAARACLDQFAEDMDKAGRSWTLETVVKWAHEWKGKNGGKDYGLTNSARFFDAVAKQRSDRKFTQLRKVAAPGEILDGVRNLPRLPAGSKTDHRATGNADEDAVGPIREDAVEAEADRGQES